MYKIKINVYLRENILDPQGKAVNTALHQLGYNEVKTVRIGKFIELIIDDVNEIEVRIKSMCEQLLINMIIEDYSYTTEKLNN